MINGCYAEYSCCPLRIGLWNPLPLNGLVLAYWGGSNYLQVLGAHPPNRPVVILKRSLLLSWVPFCRQIVGLLVDRVKVLGKL